MSAIIRQTHDTPRRALLLDLSGDDSLLRNLQLHDWVLDRVGNAESAHGLLKFHNYRVAIALLPELSDKQYEELESLLDKDEHLSWVALTLPEARMWAADGGQVIVLVEAFLNNGLGL